MASNAHGGTGNAGSFLEAKKSRQKNVVQLLCRENKKIN